MLKTRIRWVHALYGLMIGVPVVAEAPLRQTRIDPKADEVLKRMSRYLAETQRFSVEAEEMMDEVLDSGLKVQYSSTGRITLQRPSQVASSFSGEISKRQTWYNGNTLTIVDPKENTYSVVDVPRSIDGMLDHLAEKYNIIVPIADLLVSDPYGSAIRNVLSGHYFGLHHAHGIRCHHLAFRQASIDWQVWVADGDRPLPRKLVITFREMPAQPQYVVLFSNWDVSPKIPDDSFKAVVPAGARKIELQEIRDGEDGHSQ